MDEIEKFEKKLTRFLEVTLKNAYNEIKESREKDPQSLDHEIDGIILIFLWGLKRNGYAPPEEISEEYNSIIKKLQELVL